MKNGGRILGSFLSGVVLTLAAVGIFAYFKGQLEKEQVIRSCIDTYFLGEVQEQALEDGKYKGMLDALGDKYSAYYTVDETNTRIQQNEGTYRGIGVVLSQNTETGVMTVARCYPDSPAERAGILSGDVLEQIGGQSIAGMALSEVTAMIKGAGEEGITLTITREGAQEPLEFVIVPESIEYQMVESKMLEDSIGYLAIYDFVDTTYEQFHTQLEKLKEQNMSGLIVDLRNNTGGLMRSVTDILESILPKGVMVYTVDKNGKRVDYESEGKTPLEIPVVVLVNEYTASASEIFAGAIRDYEMGKLVGTKTYGKGVVQSTFYLDDGSAVKLTVANYYTPKGTNINNEGLTPDVEIALDTENTEDGAVRDNQLEKAVEIMKKLV